MPVLKFNFNESSQVKFIRAIGAAAPAALQAKSPGRAGPGPTRSPTDSESPAERHRDGQSRVTVAAAAVAQ